MHFKYQFLFMVILLLAWPLYAVEKPTGHSSVWSVSDGESTLYLGGTIHLLSQSDYPIPKPFDLAYHDSSIIIFETDLAAMESLEIQQYMLAGMLLPEGRTLKQTLSPETWEELNSYLASVGQSIHFYTRFKASMVALMLTITELKRLGMAEAGVDAFYHRKAEQDNKEIGWLESVEQHVDYLTSMGDGYEDDYLIYTLNDIRQIESMLQKLKESWRTGDLDTDQLLLEELIDNYPSVYRSLLVERNRRWIPQIENMLASPAREFVLVGKLHLSGEEGLIKILQDKGYTIKPVKE